MLRVCGQGWSTDTPSALELAGAAFADTGSPILGRNIFNLKKRRDLAHIFYFNSFCIVFTFIYFLLYLLSSKINTFNGASILSY